MFRIAFATILGLAGFATYVVGACVLFDRLSPMNPWVQIAYFLLAGTLWVIPARTLMYWAARKL